MAAVKYTTAILHKHYGKQETKDKNCSRLLPLMRKNNAIEI